MEGFSRRQLELEIEMLIDEYGESILRLCYLYTKNYAMAEDLFQEVFLKVYKNYNNFNRMSSIKTWITQIAINTCKDYLRTSWVKRILLNYNENHEESYSMEDEILERVNNDELFKEVLNLPRKYSDVLVLYYYEGFTSKEISQVLNIVESSVRSRLSRGRTMLKLNILEGEIFEYEQ